MNDQSDSKPARRPGLSWIRWTGLFAVLYVFSSVPAAIALVWLDRFGLLPFDRIVVLGYVYAPIVWPLENTQFGRAVLFNIGQVLRPLLP